ncbi:SMP-30/Gluconolaconase/LRE-like domain-containing protein [Hirsutella rhossiliensis]|uniref:SMP-30/Gluconolaconase/LRE-like domain-containing protein n=1 Tax=Hirsutella rhossiliensis TaxID=111463 RepID=A0A9P8MKP3_9HYPO|nr:SMP-30/Gluconolaconase/LRE-like domain-containing protein [Hirsutella rhossiliensis]KAH0956903.1 SMP-30/Gluconolaconase/LRE-like domain-containing protein [Hirsutella rhossiliensis]
MLWLTANMSHFVNVDLLATATNAQYLPNLLGGAVKPAISFLSYSPDFYDVMGHGRRACQQFDVVTGQPATIYAFDVVENKRLVNMRLFSYSDVGFSDGIHCDTKGNVWAGVGDGVHIWNPDGVLLGKIHIGETSNNFAFAPEKRLFSSNYRLWVVENIKAQGREVCKDFGMGG